MDGRRSVAPVVGSSNIFWFCASIRSYKSELHPRFSDFSSIPGPLTLNTNQWRISDTQVVSLTGKLIVRLLPPTCTKCPGVGNSSWPGGFVVQSISDGSQPDTSLGLFNPAGLRHSVLCYAEQ